MASRLELHNELKSLLGSNNVYFQPPESLKIKYPAIIYKKVAGDTKYADNSPYFFMNSYRVTAIDLDPDANWGDLIRSNFRYVRTEGSFTTENLNHWNFLIYF